MSTDSRRQGCGACISGLLFSHKKELNNATGHNMNGHGPILCEVRKKKTNIIQYSLLCGVVESLWLPRVWDAAGVGGWG